MQNASIELDAKAKVEQFQEQIVKALNFAHQAHYRVFRKGTFKTQGIVPYIVHPLDVLRRLESWGWTQDLEVLQAALLHDVVEDTTIKAEEIENRFGKTVRLFVEELSFRDKEEGESSHLYQEAKSAHLGEFKKKHLGSLVIKLSDRLCNVEDYLRDPLGTNTAYAKKYFNRAGGLFQAMLDRKSEFEQTRWHRMYEDYKQVKGTIDLIF